MQIAKPPGIESDAFKSAKWDELTAGRSFSQSDAPALSLLCQWYKISLHRPGEAGRRAQRQAGAEAAEGAAFSLVCN